MNNRIIPPFPEDADPTDTWKGVVDVNRRGIAIAVEMLTELEWNDQVGSGVAECDLCSLEDWPRHGTPFRNVVAEHLQRAREAGPEVEAGFCAVLGDMISLVCSGTIPAASRYDELYPPAH